MADGVIVEYDHKERKGYILPDGTADKLPFIFCDVAKGFLISSGTRVSFDLRRMRFGKVTCVNVTLQKNSIHIN